jgi:acetyl-CoA carboxylase biotin carboxyl carrier protein
MTGGTVDGDPVLVQLRHQLRKVVDEAGGPLRRVSMRSGDTVLEVEWTGPATASGAPVPAPAAPVEPVVDGAEHRLILAPIVGTFFRAPEPGAAPFVEVGDLVESGQVIGIVEAMKLMNHITAEQAGKVVEVLVDDGDPVEFQQPLIALAAG